MSKTAVMPLNDYVSACDKIREKTGETELIKSGELAEKIDDVYRKGTEAGAESGDSVFWDLFTNYGNRIYYMDAFRGTAFEYIRPTQKIIPKELGSGLRTFNDCKKLKKLEAEYFDFSQMPKGASASAGFYNTFSACSYLEEIEDIGLENQKYFSATFNWCFSLKKIARIGVSEDTVFNGTFGNCARLEDVTFDGVIGQNGLSFSGSPLLTEATLRNIVGCLKDFREKIVEDFTVNNFGGTISSSHTLVDGEKYTLTMVSDDGGTETVSGTVDEVYVSPLGETKKGVLFDFAVIYEGEVAQAWIYQEGEKLMFAMYFSRQNPKITLNAPAAEERTITFHADSVTKLETLTDNGQTLKQVANDKGWKVD